MKLLFIHHSTGANLILQGDLRALLKSRIPTLELWGHSYNLLPWWQLTAHIFPYHTGLSDQNGKLTGTDYKIEITNTDPQGYADLFSEEIHSPPDNALSKIVANFDIIMFKSCFPVTKIETEEKLKHYQDCYLKIRDTIDKLSNKKFILLTAPPLRKEMTKSEWAARARRYANWMKSNEYLEERKNMFVFDFFDALAKGDSQSDNFNMLRRDYCSIIPIDSHPNQMANQQVARKLADFISQSIII